MVVTIAIPSANRGVLYGQVQMLADASHHMLVPDYVAFTLLKLSGVSLASGTATGSAAALLAAADQDWEANYVCQANGQNLPAAPRLPGAITLFGSSGEPSASLI